MKQTIGGRSEPPLEMRRNVPGNTYTAPDSKLERVRPGLDLLIWMYRPGEVAEMEGVWDA